MATAAPSPQDNPPDPQIVTESSRTVVDVNLGTLRRNDPATAAAYVNYRTSVQGALAEKYLAEGAGLSSAREDAALDATLAANKQFAPQIIAAGAGTATTTTDPLLPQQPQPPSGPVTPVNPAANPQVSTNVSLEQRQQQLSDSAARSRQLRQQLKLQEDIIAGLNGPRRRAPPGLTALAGTGSVAVQKLRAETRIKILKEQIAAEDEKQRALQPVPATTAVSAGGGTAAALATQEQSTRDNARAQAQLTAQKAQASSGDWRVKLRLAPGSDYLYNAEEPGILKPLQVTDGVVFPYTPAISTQYVAQYTPTDLTHSNYRGYFYQSSHVGEIQLNAVFTAQDSNEAAYILAVIQFFRSVTKMFYGQDDAFRGSPPPLVFLQGLGEFQFNLAPCVVQTFNYTLPADVDYIRAGSPNVNGTNLQFRRDRQSAVSAANPSTSRLGAAGLSPGGIRVPPPAPTLGKFSPTYVPTKIDINLILLPMQTRSQISRQFSLENFANGSLVQRGFW